MQNVASTSVAVAETPGSANSFPTTELKVPRVALPPNLEGMVGNLKKVQCTLATTVPGVRQNVSSDFVIQQVMNLVPFRLPKANTQYTDPAVFFKQMGCDRPPTSCTSEHLHGFYSLTDSCLLSNWINIRDFLDFDVFSCLKKIHQNCSSDLKQNMKDMMTEWCMIREKATHNLSSGFLAYIKDVSIFHRKLRSILTRKKIDADNLAENNGSRHVEYHFPKIVAKLERNYHFLMQFIGKEHGSFLTKICLSQLSGTHNMVPTKPTRVAEVLKNMQEYAEFMVESSVLGHSSKLTHTDPAVLQNILSQLQTLVTNKNLDLLAEGCKNFRRECEKSAMHLAGQVFSVLDCPGSSYQKGMGSVSTDYFLTQIASLSNKTMAKQLLGLSMTIDFIYDLSYFVEDSVLSIVDSEYILDECYRNRIDSVFASLNNEMADFTRTENGLGEVPRENLSSSDFFELGQFLEKSRMQFYKKLQISDFMHRANDYLDSSTPHSSLMLVHVCIKKLYEVLKPLTEEAVQSLKTECSKQSPGFFSDTSLFEETQWLAKALLLVHDMGMLLKDPTVAQDIEFHPDYMELIRQYDPFVKFPMTQEVSENAPQSLNPAVYMPLEREEETKKPPVIALLPSLPPASVTSSSTHSTARAAPINRPAVRATAPSLERRDLRSAIRDTQGDLRQMSRVLRRLLGWSIEHNGERHPSIRDGRGRPVAPVPNTGHAGLGTILSVANSVCDAAEAQGLLRHTS